MTLLASKKAEMRGQAFSIDMEAKGCRLLVLEMNMSKLPDMSLDDVLWATESQKNLHKLLSNIVALKSGALKLSDLMEKEGD